MLKRRSRCGSAWQPLFSGVQSVSVQIAVGTCSLRPGAAGMCSLRPDCCRYVQSASRLLQVRVICVQISAGMCNLLPDCCVTKTAISREDPSKRDSTHTERKKLKPAILCQKGSGRISAKTYNSFKLQLFLQPRISRDLPSLQICNSSVQPRNTHWHTL